ncbi:hypothetical protein ABK040_011464 [Willaertia magna]
MSNDSKPLTVVDRNECIIKSKNDNKQYRFLTLTNGLQALLISDPSSKESACALSVFAGFSKDPVDIPGLFHYLEHMLFFSTKRFPEEGSYKKILSKYGGHCNASTCFDYTTFYFSIVSTERKALTEVMDRFSAFFICPLFEEDSMEREVIAVNSEFKRNVQNDIRRRMQLFKSCFINKEHSFSKFSTGSVESIMQTELLTYHSSSEEEEDLNEIEEGNNNNNNNNEEEEIVEEKKLLNISEDRKQYVRNTMIEYYNNWYRPDFMKLVIYSPLSLDELEEVTLEQFNNISKHNEIAPTVDSNQIEVFNQNQKICFMVPVKDIRTLQLTFQIPFTLHDYFEEKPDNFISYLIQCDAKDGLVELLRTKLGYIDNLSASTSTKSKSENFSLYKIEVRMTQLGTKHLYEIIEYTFSTIENIKKQLVENLEHCLQLYEELCLLGKLKFEWKENTSAENYCVDCVKRMHIYPSDKILICSFLNNNRPLNVDIVKKILEYLSFDNVKILVSAREFKRDEMKVEPIYGTKYYEEDIPIDIKDKLMRPKIIEEIKLPPLNPFIPRNFNLKLDEKERVLPEIIFKSDRHTLYHRGLCADSLFLEPYAQIRTRLTFQEKHVEGAKGLAFLYMFVSLVEESIDQSGLFYLGEKAKLFYSIDVKCTKKAIELSANGFSDHLIDYFKLIMQHLVNPKSLDEMTFKRIKQSLIRYYKNRNKEQALRQAKYHIRRIISQPFYEYKDLLNQIEKKDISIFDIKQFIHNFIQKENTPFQVTTFTSGNLNELQSKEIAQIIDYNLNHIGIEDTSTIFKRSYLLPLPGKTSIFEIPNTNPIDSNSSLVCTIPFGNVKLDIKLLCIMQLIRRMTKTPFFVNMRTKQQLGYTVNVFAIYPDKKKTYAGLRYAVQSSWAHPRDIYKRVEECFKNEMYQAIINVKDSTFESIKRSLIESKLILPKRMASESKSCWNDIINEDFIEKNQIEAKIIETITKEEIINCYERFCLRKEMGQITCLIYGKNVKSELEVFKSLEDNYQPVEEIVEEISVNYSNPEELLDDTSYLDKVPFSNIFKDNSKYHVIKDIEQYKGTLQVLTDE